MHPFLVEGIVSFSYTIQCKHERTRYSLKLALYQYGVQFAVTISLIFFINSI